MAIQERRGQPVVLHPGILVDVTDLKGSYELPPVVQDTDLIPLREAKTKCLYNNSFSSPQTYPQEEAIAIPTDAGHLHVINIHNLANFFSK